MAESFDPYYTWLGIPREEQPADHYRLLGIRRFESNEEVIANATDQRMGHIRTYQTGKRAKESQQLLNEIAAAQGCLLDRQKKRAYDEELRRQLGQTSPAPTAAPTPAPARRAASPALPVAAPLRPSATPAQPIDLNLQKRPAQPAVPPAPGSSPAALNLFSPPVLIGGGSFLLGLVVFVGVVIWAATRGPSVPITKGSLTPKPRPAITRDAAAKSPDSVEAPVPALPQSPETVAAIPNQTIDPAPVMPEGERNPSSSALSEPPPLATTSSQPPEIATPAVPPPSEVPSDPASAPASTDPIVARIDREGTILQHLAFSRNARFLTAYGSDRGQCYFADLTRNQPVFPSKRGRDVIVSDDETKYALFDVDHQLLVYSLHPNGGSSVSNWLNPKRDPILSGAFSSDSKLFAVALGGAQPRLEVYDLQTGKTVGVATTLSNVAWVGVQDDWLVCWSSDKQVEAISLRNYDVSHSFEPGMNFPPLTVLKAEGVPALLAGSEELPTRIELRQWNMETGKNYRTYRIEGTGSLGNFLAISYDGRIGVLRGRREIILIALMENRELTRIARPQGEFQAAALTAEDGLLAFSGFPESAWVADMKQLARQPKWQIVERDGQHVLEPLATPGSSPPAAASRTAPASPPAPAPVLSPDAGQAAIATLREAGVQIPNTVAEVRSIGTKGTQFTPEHAPLLAQFPALDTLMLNETPSAPQILQNLPVLTGLRRMDLRQTPVSDDDLKHLKQCPELRSLSLYGTKVQGPGLAHLSELKLQNIDLPSDLSTEALIPLSESAHLQFVNNLPPGMTDDDLQWVSKWKELESLGLNGARLNGSGLRHLEGLTKLKHLHVPSDLPRAAVPGLAKFKLVVLQFPRETEDADLAPFAANTSLVHVSLPERISDEGLRTVAAFPALKDVNLFSCSRLTPEGFRELAKNRTIQSIFLPQKMTDEALAELASMSQLERLYVNESSVSDQGIAALKDLPRLNHLHLGGPFTDQCVSALAEMPALRSLDLNQCQITSKGLRGLSAARNLEALTIVRMPVDDASVEALAQLTQLKALSVQNPGLSPARLEALKRALPNCSVSSS